MRKVVIVGAGALGCLFAVRLAEAGVPVTVVDVDRDRLAALRRDGITLSDDSGERTVPIDAALASEVAGPVDLVMLFTKGMHSAAAVASVAHLAGPGVYGITLQNGIGNAEVMAEVFGPDRVLHGVTEFPADLDGPTHVSSHGSGKIWLGGFTPAAAGAAQQVADLLNTTSLEAAVHPNVEVAIWDKLAFNAALNSVGAVTGLTNGEVDSEPGRRLAFAIAEEVADTAEAKSIPLDRAAIRRKIEHALEHHRGHKASMLQDRLAGRPTEIETINGAVVRAAEALGVKVPVTAALADLVRLLELRR